MENDESSQLIVNNQKFVVQDSLQAQFILGGIALNNRDYEAAVAIFSDLLRKTNSPRVKLELARALFLAHRFKDAKQVFQEVLSERSEERRGGKEGRSRWAPARENKNKGEASVNNQEVQRRSK